ncbi:MAG: hypothetical protein FJ125_00265, partial [Deltaproteobacteria bacterium]|nr:hypothetical protein [Deltaproteobacteria bacterium]
MSAADDQQPCPCERVVHPRPLGNPPGRQALTRRVGDFCSFRRALLTGRSGETALAEWRPGADGDLAVQLVEWWAYIADVLTFYDERIANESYLRTARLPESVRRLVGLLGYRPRPAIAAQGLLAGLLAEERPVTLPRGFAVQSKPGPGQQPQIFELGEATTLEPPAAIDADPPADGELAGRSDLLLEGTVTSVKPGDLLLLRSPGWSGTTGWAALRVEALQPEKDPRSRPRTRLSFALEGGSLAGADVASCRLLRPAQAAQPWPYHSGEGVSSNCTHFASLVRSLHVGDELLFEWPADSEEQTSNVVLAQVTKYYEKVWYANGPNPGTAPADPTPAIAILHSYVYYTSKDKKNTGKKSLKNAENTQSFKRRNEDDLEINDKISVIDTSSLSSAPEDQLTIHHGFVEVARLCAEPALTLTPQTTTLHAAGSVRFPPGPNRAVL